MRERTWGIMWSERENVGGEEGALGGIERESCFVVYYFLALQRWLQVKVNRGVEKFLGAEWALHDARAAHLSRLILFWRAHIWREKNEREWREKVVGWEERGCFNLDHSTHFLMVQMSCLGSTWTRPRGTHPASNRYNANIMPQI